HELADGDRRDLDYRPDLFGGVSLWRLEIRGHENARDTGWRPRHARSLRNPRPSVEQVLDRRSEYAECHRLCFLRARLHQPAVAESARLQSEGELFEDRRTPHAEGGIRISGDRYSDRRFQS